MTWSKLVNFILNAAGTMSALKLMDHYQVEFKLATVSYVGCVLALMLITEYISTFDEGTALSKEKKEKNLFCEKIVHYDRQIIEIHHSAVSCLENNLTAKAFRYQVSTIVKALSEIKMKSDNQSANTYSKAKGNTRDNLAANTKISLELLD